ncbi:hypothetical protein [Photobacterium damselae]|uniref:hypothetical protein n=1 Tax=Photobacterium damselae TaxID=38293 RepID=UPI001F3304B4|nr:hypothetical protein [Photobacterium damselae]UKA12929.1 hypothetical protein IHC91_21325 [Photobacterium damselae subsp. damselae]
MAKFKLELNKASFPEGQEASAWLKSTPPESLKAFNAAYSVEWYKKQKGGKWSKTTNSHNHSKYYLSPPTTAADNGAQLVCKVTEKATGATCFTNAVTFIITGANPHIVIDTGYNQGQSPNEYGVFIAHAVNFDQFKQQPAIKRITFNWCLVENIADVTEATKDFTNKWFLGGHVTAAADKASLPANPTLTGKPPFTFPIPWSSGSLVSVGSVPITRVVTEYVTDPLAAFTTPNMTKYVYCVATDQSNNVIAMSNPVAFEVA